MPPNHDNMRFFHIAKRLPNILLILTCVLYSSKDVRLPVQLQRVMAAEAEATREARAKV